MPTHNRTRSERTAPSGVILPSGEHVPARNGFAARHMSEIQRARMLAAMVEECAKHGPARVTVAGVVERAGVSRRTFYGIFEDCEDCLLAALEDGLRRASEFVRPLYSVSGTWRERIRAALMGLLEFAESEPVTARLLIEGSLSAGASALEHRRQVLAQIAASVDEGREASKAAKQPPLLTAEGIVGGVLSILHARLSQETLFQDTPGGLLELTGSLMSMIVLPYLGSSAAAHELKRPIPKLSLIHI